MADNQFNQTVESLFKGMDSFITTKTVVGDAITLNDAFNQDHKSNGAGGLGGKIQPSAVLVIKDGNIKLVNVKNQDMMTKILDLAPDVLNKFTSKSKNEAEDDILDDFED